MTGTRSRNRRLAIGTTAAFAVGGFSLALAGPALGSPGAGVAITPLSAGSIAGRIHVNTHHQLTDVVMVEVRLEPGGTTGWHTHAGPVAVTIDSGTARLYQPSGHGRHATCDGETVPSGSGFFEQGSDVHVLVNEGTSPLVAHATFFLPHGAAPQTDADRPAACAGIG